jgi:ubiquinone/menaquinone biosynthesis C-methylase UbiE
MAFSDDYADRNRDLWTQTNGEYTGEHAARAWARDEITWGIFGIPEHELDVLGDVAGRDVIELGCGTAYFSAWLAKRGARPVGVDVTPAQLQTARSCQLRFGLDFPLIEANAEDVPLPDASFDLAVSEYGASLWCDPYKWIPEAARLLRPGGRLVFLTNSTLVALTVPDGEGYATESLLPWHGLYRVKWAGRTVSVPHRSRPLDRSSREQFDVERLTELYAPEGARPIRITTSQPRTRPTVAGGGPWAARKIT